MSIESGQRHDGVRCTHENTVSVIADGTEKTICEECGYMVVGYSSADVGEVTRARFARRPGFLRQLIEVEAVAGRDS